MNAKNYPKSLSKTVYNVFCYNCYAKLGLTLSDVQCTVYCADCIYIALDDIDADRVQHDAAKGEG